MADQGDRVDAISRRRLKQKKHGRVVRRAHRAAGLGVWSALEVAAVALSSVLASTGHKTCPVAVVKQGE